jgi:hypothetical protein
LPLARTAAGTLDVKEDPAGLFYEARLDTSMSTAGDLVLAIERGDVTQNSFGFVVAEDRWDKDYTRRTILKIAELFDVSAVTYPASPTTWLKLKTGGSEAQRQAMVRSTLELDLLTRRFSHLNHHTRSQGDAVTTTQKRIEALALREASKLTDEERAAMLKAGERRKARLDDGRKTYRGVFGQGEIGAERR